jgi:hypothetical protein
MDKPEADRDFVDTLWRLATQNGEAHKDKDATRAVLEAFREYQRDKREYERIDFSLCRSELIRDLRKRWRNQ